MNWKRLLTGIVILVVLGGIGYWGYQRLLSPKSEATIETAVDANTITIDTSPKTISAQGHVIPLSQASLSLPVDGQVVEILVTKGQIVQAGDPLVRLDARDQETGVQKAKTTILQAQANLATAQAALASAQVNLDAANINVSAAQAQLALLQAGPTAEQIAVKEKAVAVANAKAQMATSNQNLVLEGASTADVSAAEAQLAAAQSQLLAVRIAADQILNDDHATDVQKEVAQLNLDAAISDVNAAQAALDELQAGATNAEKVAAAGAVNAAVEQRDVAQAQLELLQAGTRTEQIAIAMANIDQAQDTVTEADIRVQQAERTVSQAEAALAEANVGLDTAQAAQDKTLLLAPFAGTVADLTVKVGQVVSSGAPVITLADMSTWQVETIDLNELSVVAIAVGDPVDVTLDAFPGQHLRGQIVDIAHITQAITDEVTYSVKVALEDRSDLPLRWGMTTLITVETRKS